MPHWDARRRGDDEQRRLGELAAADAREWAKRIWIEGLPGGLLDPVAVRATYDYVDRLRQESTSIPRWAWANQDAMRGYVQMMGNRYYDAFYSALAKAISGAIEPMRALPRTTPLPTHFPDLVTPLVDEYGVHDETDTQDSRDWSGTHPTQQEGAS